MVTLTDNGHRVGAYIISESDGATGGMYSRDAGILALGNLGKSGLVVGAITASGKFTALATGASDGSQNAAAVLFSDTDASGGDKEAVFTKRQSEVSDAELIWPGGITGPQKIAAVAALAAKGIIVRT